MACCRQSPALCADAFVHAACTGLSNARVVEPVLTSVLNALTPNASLANAARITWPAPSPPDGGSTAALNDVAHALLRVLLQNDGHEVRDTSRVVSAVASALAAHFGGAERRRLLGGGSGEVDGANDDAAAPHTVASLRRATYLHAHPALATALCLLGTPDDTALVLHDLALSLPRVLGGGEVAVADAARAVLKLGGARVSRDANAAGAATRLWLERALPSIALLARQPMVDAIGVLRGVVSVPGSAPRSVAAFAADVRHVLCERHAQTLALRFAYTPNVHAGVQSAARALLALLPL